MSKNHESDSRHVYLFIQEFELVRQPDDDKTRHDYKLIAEEKGLTTSSERSSITPWTNQKTIDKNVGILKEFRGFSRVNGFGKDLRTMPAAAVSAFVNHKIIDDGVGRQRVSDILSCINKAGAFCGNEGYTSAVKELRSDLMPNLQANPALSRAFADPSKVIQTIKSEPAKLAAEIQLRTGLRADNALNFRINPDGLTVSFTSKGGIPHANFVIPSDLLERAKAYADASGNVSIMPYRSYARAVEQAAKSLGERVEVAGGKFKTLSSHAFRHCFAKAMYNDLIKKGVSVTDAKAQVSEALFHKRLDIVELYIR